MTSDAALITRMLATLRHVQDLVAETSGGRALAFDGGVHAPVVPSAPGRSFFNAVVYDHAAALEAALPEIARAYEDAGVWSWTVWTPEADMDAAALLADAGHELDGVPRAMVADLVGWTAPAGRPLDDGVVVERTRDTDVVGRVSGEVFALYPEGADPPPVVGNPLAGVGDAAHLYVGRIDGEAVATTGAFDHDGDAGIYWVSTKAQARGRGIATALMELALSDARERGCLTSSLQATAMGAPIYAKLGYRDLGAVQMWERRRLPSAIHAD